MGCSYSYSLPNVYADIEAKNKKIAAIQSNFSSGDRINIITKDSCTKNFDPSLSRYNEQCAKVDIYYFNKICHLTDTLIKKLKKHGYNNTNEQQMYEMFVDILTELTMYYMRFTRVDIHSTSCPFICKNPDHYKLAYTNLPEYRYDRLITHSNKLYTTLCATYGIHNP